MSDRANIEYMAMIRLSPATKYILKALVPYTDANLRLAFKPISFFNKLAKLSNQKERTLRSAYYRAIKSELLELDSNNIPRLTDKGRDALKIYQPTTFGKDARLLITFDIPESQRIKRARLRTLLRELRFIKIQQSVWITKYDCREYLATEIKESGLTKYVIIYEAVKLNIAF